MTIQSIFRVLWPSPGHCKGSQCSRKERDTLPISIHQRCGRREMLELETLTETFTSSHSICAIGKLMRESIITYFNRGKSKIFQDRNFHFMLCLLVLQRADAIRYDSGSHSATSETPQLSVYSLRRKGPSLFSPRGRASTPAVSEVFLMLPPAIVLTVL